MDEKHTESALGTYRLQILFHNRQHNICSINAEKLNQVEAALLASGEENNQELSKLREDLKELITLTEESLLKLKKERLLSMLDSVGGASTCQSNNQTSGDNISKDDLDDEFAAFKASLGNGSSRPSASSTSATVLSESTDSDSSEDGALDSSIGDVFKDIIGSRCLAPFSHSWGEQSYHNAMVISVCVEGGSDSEEQAEETGDGEPQANILYTNPTHRSMVPCQYFLDDKCNYGDKCRFSHGHNVPLSKLKEYREPDYSSLQLESKVLAQSSDRVWYPAVIVDLFPDNSLKVMFDRNDEVMTLKMEDVLPMDSTPACDSVDSSSESGADDRVAHSSEEDEDGAELPVFLWRPGQNGERMGEWEQHTRGIASRLMQKMGYVSGEGLGRDSQGRVEPIPIQLLPQGKSLDKIMELKALAGDRDLFDVLKKREKQQRRTEAKNRETYKKERQKEETETNMFDFINKKLHSHSKKAHHGHQKQPHSHHSNTAKQITVKDLKDKSDKSLNIQLFQTMEEINSTEKEINRLKSTLTRNQQSDPVFTSKVQPKLVSLQKYLGQLQRSQRSLEQHKQSRSDKKKLSVF